MFAFRFGQIERPDKAPGRVGEKAGFRDREALEGAQEQG